MRIIDLHEQRAAYATLLEDLAQSKEPVVIEREGRPLGAFVPYDLYRQLFKWWDYEKNRQLELAKAERDRAAYLAMKAELLDTHRGEFVCFRDGELIGIDKDEQTLVKRVYGQYGYGPIFLHKIEESEPVYRIPFRRTVS